MITLFTNSICHLQEKKLKAQEEAENIFNFHLSRTYDSMQTKHMAVSSVWVWRAVDDVNAISQLSLYLCMYQDHKIKTIKHHLTSSPDVYAVS